MVRGRRESLRWTVSQREIKDTERCLTTWLVLKIGRSAPEAGAPTGALGDSEFRAELISYFQRKLGLWKHCCIQTVTIATKTVAWIRVAGQTRGRLLPYSSSGLEPRIKSLESDRRRSAGIPLPVVLTQALRQTNQSPKVGPTEICGTFA